MKIIKLTDEQFEKLLDELQRPTSVFCPEDILKGKATGWLSNDCKYCAGAPIFCRQCWKEAIEQNNKESK